MVRLLKALIKLFKGKIKISIGVPGGGTVDINLDKKPGIMSLVSAPVESPVKFNIWLGLWKAVRGALLGTLVLFLSTGEVDKFFDLLKENISTTGYPAWFILTMTALIPLLRNLIKQALASIPVEKPNGN